MYRINCLLKKNNRERLTYLILNQKRLWVFCLFSFYYTYIILYYILRYNIFKVFWQNKCCLINFIIIKCTTIKIKTNNNFLFFLEDDIQTKPIVSQGSLIFFIFFYDSFVYISRLYGETLWNLKQGVVVFHTIIENH